MIFATLMICFLLFLETNSFQTFAFLKRQSYKLCSVKQPYVIPAAPSKVTSKVVILLKGPNVNNALFRASLKKELTFYRGCAAVYKELSAESSEITAEGKTEQLVRFFDWLSTLGTELSKRKPNFQGPTLVINIEKVQWKDYTGNLKGFSANVDAPQISPEVTESDGTLEAKSMTGTDESV